jgi:hypothetical protein
LRGGQPGSDQRQSVALLVDQVGGQRRGQDVDDVGEPVHARPVVRCRTVSAAPGGPGQSNAAPGERVVHGGEQRIDLRVLGPHRFEHGQGVLAAGEPGPQRGPDKVVLGAVVQVQLMLEHLPARRDRAPPGGVGQIPGRRPRQALQVPAERGVRGEHDGQVCLAGTVPGSAGARQLVCGHQFPLVIVRCTPMTRLGPLV